MGKRWPGDPATASSLDLALSRLPELVRMAEAAAPGDPLVTRLWDVGCDYPLSSAGIPGMELRGDERPLLGHAVMRRLHADRIIERRAADRLANPDALAAVRESLGNFTDSWAGPAPAFDDQEREHRR
jgi:hypothetical protein